MANTQAPFGFVQFGLMSQTAPTMGMEKFLLLSSDTGTYFTGDPVALSTTNAGYLTLPGTGNVTILGIFQGCEYYDASVNKITWNSYFPASVGSSSPVTAYVITDPNATWLAQTSTQSVLGSTNVGMNIGWSSASQANGNTLSGRSAVLLNSTSLTANASEPFRIVDIYQNFAPPGVNGVSTDAGCFLIVKGNNWARNITTGQST